MAQKTFYITTPIYYPSGKLHIGNSFTTVFCDSIMRYKKLRGYDTYYLTGMDEHGQKVETVAKELGRSPQEHVDLIAHDTKKLWELLDIEYDDFIRTTQPRHEKVVEEIFEQLLGQDDIYLGHYEGHYCIYDESFFTETQLEDGNICPDCGRPTKLVKEESYFLRLSKYEDWLLQFIEENPDFITPETRKNEVVSFIKNGLQDLSVSRTSFDWGVNVKSNPKHVVYVWVDALSNYITALGYGSKDTTLYDKYWKGDEVLHVVGKDILRFHAIYWPIMLHAIGVPVNFKLYAHGWYLMKDGKMSKSKGKVVYPDDLVPHYGLDAMRYFLLKEIPYSGDGVFTPEDFIARINYDLANDFGNLLNRTINMINKYFNSKLTKPEKSYFPFDEELKDTLQASIDSYKEDMDEWKVSSAIQHIWTTISRSNKYIDETMPWVLAKDHDKQAELNSVLYNLVEALRHIGILLKPILINASQGLFEQLNIPSTLQTWDSLDFGLLKEIHVTDKPQALFPRLDKKKEEAFITELLNPVKKEEPKEENFITIDDFTKLELVVGEVQSCKAHPNADKLLVSQVDTGDRVRQIVSGVSKYYTPEEMVGKKLVVIKNLKPVTLRGELSEGMVLAGSNKKALQLVELDQLKPGDKVS
ncbi:methionine--tRNA ligase [Candidatus Xianfuyuplasma coldseepsis]|uniref:Methionine--tRNA ligase n=1 Tax=Candidatus Xianfuyuplasma coldseepsis TaxID=2782163 RepID=A0A7L7KR78_9MOLU|nr:methionine--tRNA ligase [Xianfuyuplasma coldseepsis]QMS85233.1 methionine--tRNA ligase [Xianfuyuplasma coldseepsis]